MSKEEKKGDLVVLNGEMVLLHSVRLNASMKICSVHSVNMIDVNILSKQ